MEETRSDEKDRIDGVIPVEPEREGRAFGGFPWKGIAVTVAALGITYVTMEALYEAVRAGRISSERTALARTVADARARAELCREAGMAEADARCAKALKISLFGSEELADDIALCEKAPRQSQFCSATMDKLATHKANLALGQATLEAKK